MLVGVYFLFIDKNFGMKKISLYILILTIILNTSQVFANMAFNPWPGQYGVNSWGDNTYSYDDIPARLADNIKSGYSKMYNWDYAMRNFKAIIDKAFENRIKMKDNIDNSRKQMQNNTTGLN